MRYHIMKLKNGFQTGIPNSAYHADRARASKSWLDKIATTPYHLRSYLDTPPEAVPAPALVMGSAVDCLIFEPESFEKEFLVMPEELNLRTKDGRAKRDELVEQAKTESKTVISFADKLTALETAAAVRKNPVMADFLSAEDGVAQPVFAWDDPVTGIKCKCKADWYIPSEGIVVDLKTARSASPNDFSRSVANFRYHVQDAFYSDGIRACGMSADRFVFAVIEKPNDKLIVDPRLMAFYELEQDDKEAGRSAYASDLAALNFCIINNDWPGYTDEVLTITRPAWARRDDVESISEL